jgi:plastocyanin
MHVRDEPKIVRWLPVLLLACATCVLGKTYEVGIGDDCDPGVIGGTSFGYASACFTPAVLTINVGDSVHFYQYADTLFTGPHNVVADDGSFRCARGCDGEGGDGTPTSDSLGFGFTPQNLRMDFTLEFDTPGVVKYHDEVTGAPGVIYVGVSPSGAIDGAYTGTWFNSAQSGMGFMVEVLPGSPMQMLAAWLTFSPQGDPSWIVGLGPIAGNRAILPAIQTVGSGARFPPSFDPTHVTSQSWGTLTFTFSDCNHGHVDWSSTIPGYGSGGMDLMRLTQPAGLNCPVATNVQPAAAATSP